MQAKQQWKEKPPDIVPSRVQTALKEAMHIENVSPTDFNDLLWIITQESAGIVGVRNPKSSARGLFQLTRVQYGLNPNGEKSFGNAIEECQGGIRYIHGRYGTAGKAKEFWKQHHWY
jgi:SLT domain-containing protein